MRTGRCGSGPRPVIRIGSSPSVFGIVARKRSGDELDAGVARLDSPDPPPADSGGAEAGDHGGDAIVGHRCQQAAGSLGVEGEDLSGVAHPVVDRQGRGGEAAVVVRRRLSRRRLRPAPGRRRGPGAVQASMTNRVPDSLAISVACPSSPKPVTSVAARTPDSTSTSAAARLRRRIEATAAARCSGAVRSLRSALTRMPVPSGLVRKSVSPAWAAPLRRIDPDARPR